MLIPLLKAEVIIYAAKSLLILAYLTDEENNHVIMADEGKYTYFANKVGVERSSKWDHNLKGSYALSHPFLGPFLSIPSLLA